MIHPLLVLGILWAVSQHNSAGAGNLTDQKTGPDALANLQRQGVAMTERKTRSKAETSIFSEWWAEPKNAGADNQLWLVWASDDPASWALYRLNKAPTLPTELARGKGAKTNVIASALSRRVLN